MRNKVLIYEDYGCADISVLAKELRTYFEPRGCKVGFTNANEIISRNSLNQEVLAFFIPGGASTPYRHKLEVLGNAKIREYVQQGGVYYGICAGAYYACKHTEFEKDVPESRIIAEYKLDLLNAKAIGSLYKELNIEPFAKNTASSAAGIHGGHPALEREVIAPCLELSTAAPDLLDHVGNAPVTA